MLTNIASVIAAGVLAFGGTLALLPLAHRYGLVDVPCGRHNHPVPTPVVGGVAIFTGASVTLALSVPISDAVVTYIAASALIVLVGVIDDLRDLRWWVRGLAQVLAALIIAIGGARAESVGDLLTLGAWSVPFTVFATVGVINAINMIDGADGLAASQVAIALAYFAAIAAAFGNNELLTIALILLGAVVGFLALNVRHRGQPRARAFLGNSGSAYLGLTIAWVSFCLAREPGQSAVGIIAPWLVAIPLIDCVVVFARRGSLGRSPFSADRNHIHHLMLDAGFSTQAMVGLLAMLSVLGGTFALAWHDTTGGQAILVVVFLAILALHFVLTRRRERVVDWLGASRRILRSPDQLVTRAIEVEPDPEHASRRGRPTGFR
ncbi:MraY family glycosyltransferase [Tahibacter amnicola]|uniref:Undecaprenyl/decaprenyl-phosphate alpha-N-acetylglucosaminyl 1-phosphate transferase n=1 Tax=Tahibacter amnicola TaxID=2976241 RepID=A0ABY6BB72_9GAMM|nr:MraY family glycosyltransferase [Tahibacter amnicola]UXI66403.1 undecaprenyl/decaprenyl-phosphate alpha-N-acetylglucosaminyl 1-phosphate transferase [Tahibacter amnicola]